MNTTTALLQTSLCHYIDNLHSAWPSIPVILYRPRSHFATIPYPKPNLTLHELWDPHMTLYSVEWTIFKILCKGDGGVTGYSALGPKIFYDALLPAICHQIRGCRVSRSVACAFYEHNLTMSSSGQLPSSFHLIPPIMALLSALTLSVNHQ